MSLTPGSRLGPYEIIASIGAGGMGEVYKAKDSRLGREVAIKVLPDAVARDPDRRQRFEREARAASALNHPNICTVYDIGQQDGTDFMVMEFIDGEPLDRRLRSGPLPVTEAVQRASEIANALGRAHSHGIVHRDLKPGNVILSKTGAKLLDFGLAKLVERELPVGNATTQVNNLTSAGEVLGTLQYMAPEQLQGRNADARADIFAFGAMLYEMLTGRRAFAGTTQSSLIGAILTEPPPPMSSVNASVAPPLDEIVRVALEKDPDARWQNAQDVARQLQWIAATSGTVAVRPAPRPRKRAPWIVGAATVMILAATAVLILSRWRSSPAPMGPAIRFPVSLPAGVEFSSAGVAPFPAISPDGRQIVFQAASNGGPLGLWVRSLESSNTHPLIGTMSGTIPLPFWAPDSRSIGFFADGKLARVDLEGGTPQAIVESAPVIGGASWGPDGTILYGDRDGIYRVASTGGPRSRVTTVDDTHGERSHSHPWFLPDGRNFLYLSHGLRDWVYVGSLDQSAPRRLFEADGIAYTSQGYLLFVRRSALLAQRFDPSRLQLVGEPVVIAPDVRYNPSVGRAAFSASTNGVLVYRAGGATTRGQLAWFDRNGKKLATMGGVAQFTSLSLSSDNQFAIAELHDETQDTDGLWRIDFGRGTSSRVTSAAHRDRAPVLSPSGEWVVFASDRSGAGDLYKKRADGLGSEELVVKSPLVKSPQDWSAHWIVFTVNNPAQSDLWILPTDGKAEPRAYLQTEFDEDNGRLSPDEQWIAYESDETGRPEIYIRPFPDANAGKWRISDNTGMQPRWWPDGRGLYYLTSELPARYVSVPLMFRERAVEPGTPRFLFTRPSPLVLSKLYEPSRDGTRFLIPTSANTDREPDPLMVLVNWPSLLTKK